jgi:hypothetical protein
MAMTDGWTSGGGLGLGLSGAKRLVHEFAIESILGKGTRVVVVRWREFAITKQRVTFLTGLEGADGRKRQAVTATSAGAQTDATRNRPTF